MGPNEGVLEAVRKEVSNVDLLDFVDAFTFPLKVEEAFGEKTGIVAVSVGGTPRT